MKRLLIKAMLRSHCLPLSFSSFCYPKKGSFNGVRFLFVYVEPLWFRKLFETELKVSCESRNVWDYYFIGFGFHSVTEEDFDREVHLGDWTFQGDDDNRPIINLEGLDET